jgi:hypothetical protein
MIALGVARISNFASIPAAFRIAAFAVPGVSAGVAIDWHRIAPFQHWMQRPERERAGER